MDTTQYISAIETAVKGGELHEAFRLLRTMTPGDAWLLKAEIDRAEEDYGRIIDYALTGAPDPGRTEQLSALAGRIYNMLDLTVREKEIQERSTLYYNTVRTERKSPSAESLCAMMTARASLAAEISPFNRATMSPSSIRKTQSELESLDRRIFERVWTALPLGGDEYAMLSDLLRADEPDEGYVSMLIGALTLSALEWYNERALLLLLDGASQANAGLRVRATTGALLVMYRWPRRSDSAAVGRRLQALRDGGYWSKDVEWIYMQFIRTADVESLSRTMRDEIIPEMIKLRPDLYKRINEDSETQDFEMNPEWEELLDKSGIADRLRKLSDLQSEGGDLFYSAFSMLKGYPFFSHISHWFIPFDIERPDVADALGHELTLAHMVAATPTMCDSDKYSFVFSLDRLPEAHRQALMAQMEQADIDLTRLDSAALLPDEQLRHTLITRYVQDLYRFFNLFRRKGEFVNPFASLVSLDAVPALEPDLGSPEKIRLIGEFYFKHSHWRPALAMFSRLEPDLSIYQKMGLCCQHLGMHDRARESFERAEMLAPDSTWTLRHLASALRACGLYEKALDVYRRLDALDPDKPAVALAMGHCCLHLDDRREALHCYYKAEFLDEKSTAPLRPIAWCSFLNRDFETSARYYDRLMAVDTPSASDYLNMGHLAVATGRMRDAMNFYTLHSSDPAELRRHISADLPLLERTGVDISVYPLILDAILYRS